MAFSNIFVGAGTRPAQPVVRKIGLADLRDADTRHIPLHHLSDRWLCIGAARIRLLHSALALSIGERVCAGWSDRRAWSLRAEPSQGSRPRNFGDTRLRRI